MEEEMDLVLETRTEENGTPVVKAGGLEVAFTPPIGEDYWCYRVRLSPKQAVVGFPKFSTIGIGFAVEKADWNTNLPYNCPAEDILKHIKHNKGSRKIADRDVLTAIQMIQAAAMADRNEERRAMVKWDISSDPRENARMLDESLRAMGKAVREVDTLLPEVTRLRVGLIQATSAAAAADLARETVEQELIRTKIELAAALADRDGLSATLSRLSPAGLATLQVEVPAPDPADDGPLVSISASTDLVPWEGDEAEEVSPEPVAPPVLSDGGQVFMSTLLRLGRPTRDGRTLASMGAYSMADTRHGVPLQRLVDSTSPHAVTDIVGRIMAVVRDGDDILAVGVAEPDVAAGLNTGALCLAADLEADPVAKEHGGLEFAGGRVRGARVREGGTFAWE
jgi:hypothetical protein